MIARLPGSLQASVRRALRQTSDLADADKAGRLLRNLERRLKKEAPGVASSLVDRFDKVLTVNKLALAGRLPHSLAYSNSIKNMMGTVRRVCGNVKRWRNAAITLCGTAAGVTEAAKGFRRLKAYRQFPILRAVLLAHANKHVVTNKI